MWITIITDTLIELFKIDMETQKENPQGTASLAGAEFRWNYYDGFYTKDSLPSKPTRTWTTRTVEEKDKQGNVHYITKLADAYKVSGDAFYMQNGKAVLPPKAGEKNFQPEQKVKLINPRITADGYNINGRGFTNYILLADDMLPVESK